MTRGPRLAAHGKAGTVGKPVRSEAVGRAPAPFDLGIALSVYGKDPAGRLIELYEPATLPSFGDTPPGLGGWSTEQ